MLRSFLAVLAGLAAMMALVIASTLLLVVLLHIQTSHPTRAYMVLNVLMSILAAILGGYITARIARREPLKHGIVLGAIMLALAIFGLLHPQPGQPPSYLIELAVIPPLAAVYGAYLAATSRRLSASV